MPKVRKEGGMVKMKRESGEPVYHRTVGRKFALHGFDFQGPIYDAPMIFLRAELGVCPQHNRVWDLPLSPASHKKQKHN